MKEEKVTERKVEFYSPHPGFAGTVVQLPESMRKAAEDLDGKSLTLDEAIRKLQPMAEKLGGKVAIAEEHKYIRFQMEGRKLPHIKHVFGLIRYK